MLDFRLHPALTLPPDMPLADAQQSVKNSHSSAVLVVDRFDQFCGAATHHCLSGQTIMQLVGKGRRREDLQLRDLMHPKDRLNALSLGEVENASVGKLISLLQKEGAPLILVVDEDHREVVGMLSAPEIGRVLDLKLTPAPQQSFLDIFTALKA
jgi:CBS domain containing-hemolysin-like protein